MNQIRPFLWFDSQAEEAASYYVSIFPNSRVIGMTRYGEHGPGAKGSVMTVEFELNGLAMTALNGGPVYKLTPAFSLAVSCETQAEIDRYWEKLTAGGGAEVQCGWLTDKFGVSWQVVPRMLPEVLSAKDAAASNRVMTALFSMKKLDIAALENARDGR